MCCSTGRTTEPIVVCYLMIWAVENNYHQTNVGLGQRASINYDLDEHAVRTMLIANM
jgi:hypothetical protein